MSRNRFWGGLVGLVLFLLVLGGVGFAAYQMGAASGAGAEILGSGGAVRMGYHGYGFFPFFWGFGFLKFFFFLFFGMLILRLFFRPWRMMGRGGHWKGGHEGPWADRMKEVHDSWHADNPGTDPPEEPAA